MTEETRKKILEDAKSFAKSTSSAFRDYFYNNLEVYYRCIHAVGYDQGVKDERKKAQGLVDALKKYQDIKRSDIHEWAKEALAKYESDGRGE